MINNPDSLADCLDRADKVSLCLSSAEFRIILRGIYFLEISFLLV